MKAGYFILLFWLTGGFHIGSKPTAAAADSPSSSSATKPGDDADGDALSNALEALYGTKPNPPNGWDSDSDGVSDGLDGWALDPDLAPPRLSETRYAVIDLSAFGIKTVNSISDDCDFHYQDINNNHGIFLTRTRTPRVLEFPPQSLFSGNGRILGYNLQGYPVYAAVEGENVEVSALSSHGSDAAWASWWVSLYISNSLFLGSGGWGGARESYHAGLIWEGGQPATLGTVEHYVVPDGLPDDFPASLVNSGTQYTPMAASNRSDIAVHKYTFSAGPYGGTWSDGGVGILKNSDFFPLPDSQGVKIHSMNAADQIAALGYLPQIADETPLLWLETPTGFKAKRVGSWEPGRDFSELVGFLSRINDRYEMAGWIEGANGKKGGLIRNSKIFSLQELIGNDSYEVGVSSDINNRGVIVCQGKKNGVDKPLILVPSDIIPDFNRDGVIDTKDQGRVTNDDPWRWWINDDDDAGSIEGSDVPASGHNGQDLKVDGLRDLVDWFPVFLDIKQLLEVLPPSDYDYIIENEDKAFNLVETTLSKDKAGDFIRGELGEPQDRDNPNGLARLSAPGYFKNVAKQTAKLSAEFLASIEDETGGVLLIEASKVTTKPLRLVVRKGGSQVGELSFPIATDSVENMFRHVNLAASAAGVVTVANRLAEPTNYPDKFLNESKNFVFIHGYNISQNNARGWQAEAFKRLHQLGSQAKFVGVTWNGDTGVDYHQAVKYAFLTGQDLVGELQPLALKGVTVIAAHSLGNIVASSAIEDTSFSPEYYYMINAAVPIEAYDPAQQNGEDGVEMELRMTEDGWKGYRGVADKVIAYNWHNLFNDARNQMTWKGRFKSAIAVAYNFYSTGEDVVENAYESENVNSNSFRTIWGWIKDKVPLLEGNPGRHAWIAQEIAKGSKNIVLNSTSMLGDGMYGGWGFNNFYENKSAFYAASISNATLCVHPFFEKFERWDFTGGGIFMSWNGEKLMAPNGDSEAGNEALKPITRLKLLAEAIPTKSFAAAANRMASLDEIGPNRNQNMMALKNGNDWPSGIQQREDDWFHCDLKVVSFNYVWPMWQKMIDIASLDQ